MSSRLAQPNRPRAIPDSIPRRKRNKRPNDQNHDCLVHESHIVNP